MMKTNKLICILLAMFLWILPIGFNSKVEASNSLPNVSAHAYTIMDVKSGEILYSKNNNKIIYPASTAKMMTALVAIENCSLSKKITVKESVVSKVHPEATQLGLKGGSTYSLEELLNMLLVYSSADAADTIAVEIAGSISNFTTLMNKKAKSLGMSNTNFDNAIGLDFGGFNDTYSTSNDITVLTKALMKNSTLRKIVAKPSYTIKSFNGGASRTIKNSNNFLNGQYYPKDLYTIIGTKTGTTDKAGYALATTAVNKSDREIICSFFGNSTRSQMFKDIESLLTYTYKNLSNNYGWKLVNNEWYYYDKNGSLKKGWLKYDNDWYYLKSNGTMAKGWNFVSGSWYHLQNNGVMTKGWLFDKNNWYHLQDNGAMTTGWLFDKNSWYHLQGSGSMTTGWLFDKNSWYHLKGNGSMTTGWLFDKNNWYHLKGNGSMTTGWLFDKNNWYHLKGNGSMTTGWLFDKNNWYHLKGNGSMTTGWLFDKNNWYYLYGNGIMATNTIIDGWQIDYNGIATFIN